MKPRLQSRDGNFRAMRIRSFSGRPGLEPEAISSTFFCGTRRFRFNGRSFMRMSFPLPIHWTTFMRCSLRTASSAARAVRPARAALEQRFRPHSGGRHSADARIHYCAGRGTRKNLPLAARHSARRLRLEPSDRLVRNHGAERFLRSLSCPYCSYHRRVRRGGADAGGACGTCPPDQHALLG